MFSGFGFFPEIEFIKSMDVSIQLTILFIISIITLVSLYLYLKQGYVDPIRILRTEIAHFLAGAQSPKRLELK